MAINQNDLPNDLLGDLEEPTYLGLDSSTWCRIAVIACLFGAVFWPNLRRLWLKTNPFTGEANWGHSIFIPIIGFYYLVIHREELLQAGPRPFIWGPFLRKDRLWSGIGMLLLGALLVTVIDVFDLSVFKNNVGDIILSGGFALCVFGLMVLAMDWSLAITFFGLVVYVYGIYPGQNDYVKDLGMVINLFGIVLMMCGWGVMRIAWFPIAFLICAIPWPALVYSWVAGPLQVLAAHVAVNVLKITGVDAACSGTKIVMEAAVLGMPPRILNVAEACAGLKSLMTFISVGAAVAFLSPRPLWQKLFITASAGPIAIFCNVMRVSGQGLLDHYWTQKLSDGFAHQFVGTIMLIPAFFMILFVGYLLDKIFIEEADEDPYGAPAPAGPTLVTKRVGTAVKKLPESVVQPRASAAVNTKPVIVAPAPTVAKTPTAAHPPAVTKPPAPVSPPATPINAPRPTVPRNMIIPPRPAALTPLFPPRGRTPAPDASLPQADSAQGKMRADKSPAPRPAKPSGEGTETP